MVGPVLAFRGELEAQGRGSLHPHILVWLVCQVQHEIARLLKLLRADSAELQRRLCEYMRLLVASQCSVSQASVEAAPRLFGDTASQGPAPKLTAVAQKLCKFDGGSELDVLREKPDQTDLQKSFLETADDKDWKRPCLSCSQPAPPSNVYAKRLDEFPVAKFPAYRRIVALHRDKCSEQEMTVAAWQTAFLEDHISALTAA